MRVVGLDLGEKRIGVAVSDATGLLASPREIVERNEDWLVRVEEIVREVGAEAVVVGLPVSLDGRADRSSATSVAAEARALAERLEQLDVQVEMQDERLTTTLAMRLGRITAAPAGEGRKARRPRGQARNRRYDAEAVALILQSWLDARRSGKD